LIIFIVPKNSGLEICSDYIEKYKSRDTKIVRVRGEDVPLFVENLINQDKNVIGITGEDLFNEFKLKSNSKIEIIENIIWNDPRFMFGKPTLCLLGPKEKKLESLPNNLKICINSKYKEIANNFLNNLKEKGYFMDKIIDKIYTSGATEEFYSSGISDLVIDIVCTGGSIEKAGLSVYEKIFSSDIVVLGKPENGEFSLETLYEIIKQRINSSDEKSYTKKLINNQGLLKRKIIEEAGEVITADNKEGLIWECSDLLYFLLVFMAINNISLEDIYKENQRRDKETLLNQNNLNKNNKEGEK
jgi:ATP phosphoribosyltransferase